MSIRNQLLTHPIVAAHLPKPPRQLASRVGAMVDAIEADKLNFKATPTEVASTREDLAALNEAIRNVESKQPGAVQARHVCLRTVRVDVSQLVNLVQVVANTMPRDSAGKFITSLHFEVSKVGQRGPRAELTIRQMGEPGSVKAISIAQSRPAIYYFEWSVDNKTFVAAPARTASSMVITGLTPGQTYYFRVRAMVKDTMKEYSPVVTFMVK